MSNDKTLDVEDEGNNSWIHPWSLSTSKDKSSETWIYLYWKHARLLEMVNVRCCDLYWLISRSSSNHKRWSLKLVHEACSLIGHKWLRATWEWFSRRVNRVFLHPKLLLKVLVLQEVGEVDKFSGGSCLAHDWDLQSPSEDVTSRSNHYSRIQASKQSWEQPSITSPLRIGGTHSFHLSF